MDTHLFLAAAPTIGLASYTINDDRAITNTKNLTLNLQCLEDLSAGNASIDWIVVNGTPVASGTFTSNSSGTRCQIIFALSTAAPNVGTSYMLAIEPGPDGDPAPSDVSYIAGAFLSYSAIINTNFGSALGNFKTVSGSVFLRTATNEVSDAGKNGDDTNGLWFGLPNTPPSANSNLLGFPAGWIYEGWVVGDARPVITRTFTDLSTVDSGAYFSGTPYKIEPPEPVEDFFRDLPLSESRSFSAVDRATVLIIEPIPKDAPDPFALKPLAAMASTAAAAPVPQTFNDTVNASFPTGSVTRL